MTTSSTSLTTIEAIAKDIDSHLSVLDPRFNDMVQVHGQEDTLVHLIPDAFCLKHGCWFLVFSEHHGYHVYHEEEARVVQYTRMEIEELTV